LRLLHPGSIQEGVAFFVFVVVLEILLLVFLLVLVGYLPLRHG
jgi:hypothetical protein